MHLNLTLPGLGGGAKKQPVQEAKPMLKQRYWTPGTGDYEKGVQYGQGGGMFSSKDSTNAAYGGGGAQYPSGSGYTAGDPFYNDKAWDKRTQTWVMVDKDEMYRKNAAGEQLLWQPPKEPQKKGMLK